MIVLFLITALLSAFNPCAVSSIKLMGAGGDQDWSSARNLIAYDRVDNGTYQLHTIRPDGTGDTALVLARTDRHRMNPTWNASGEWLIVQAEMDTHPLSWDRDAWVAELVMNGLWSNLYAVRSDGTQWTRLTDYANTKTDGAMAAHFSADGSQVLWSRLVGNASSTAPFGTYRLMLADFAFDDSGVPTLSNVQDITPDGANLIEAHGFSPDGSKVLFTSDLTARGTWGMDQFTMDLATREVVNLTSSPYWEEHGSWSPSGKKIAYMSSQPYLWLMFLTEEMIRDIDTGKVQQITHYNISGATEYTKGGSMATRSSWSPDGSRLALTQQLSSGYPARQLWMISFAGRCG